MKNIIHFILILFIVTSCNTNQTDISSDNQDKTVKTNQQQDQKPEVKKGKGIPRISKTNSSKFATARIKALKPKLINNEVVFNFKIDNFDLRKITTGYKKKFIVNEEKGQYIKVIINNEDEYIIHKNQLRIPNDRKNYSVIAFLCTSYHESLKHKNAYTIFNYNSSNTKFDYVEYSEPVIILNHPAETESLMFEGKDRLLLDFYVFNADLHLKKDKIKVTVNNKEFFLTEWVTYNLDGLKPGRHQIELQIIDKNYNNYNNPPASVKQTFVIKREY